MPAKQKHDKTTEKELTCFVISEIGEEGSVERARADTILRHIIEPAAETAGFGKPVRADHIAEPGLISDQIIARLLEADVVVADLTGLNPNVFYELAMRHMVRGATIHLRDADTRIPFDIKDIRIVTVGTHVETATAAKAQLATFLAAARQDASSSSQSPFTRAIDLQRAQESAGSDEDAIGRVVSDLSEEVSRLRAQVDRQQREIRRESTASPNRFSDAYLRSLGLNPSIGDRLALVRMEQERRAQELSARLGAAALGVPFPESSFPQQQDSGNDS